MSKIDKWKDIKGDKKKKYSDGFLELVEWGTVRNISPIIVQYFFKEQKSQNIKEANHWSSSALLEFTRKI